MFKLSNVGRQANGSENHWSRPMCLRFQVHSLFKPLLCAVWNIPKSWPNKIDNPNHVTYEHKSCAAFDLYSETLYLHGCHGIADMRYVFPLAYAELSACTSRSIIHCCASRCCVCAFHSSGQIYDRYFSIRRQSWAKKSSYNTSEWIRAQKPSS